MQCGVDGGLRASCHSCSGFSSSVAFGLAQGSGNAQWDAVGRILKSPPAPAAGYPVQLPPPDIKLTIGDVTCRRRWHRAPGPGFSGDSRQRHDDGRSGAARRASSNRCWRNCHRQHIAVMAIHNHLAGESPPLSYVHYHAEVPPPTWHSDWTGCSPIRRRPAPSRRRIGARHHRHRPGLRTLGLQGAPRATWPRRPRCW